MATDTGPRNAMSLVGRPGRTDGSRADPTDVGAFGERLARAAALDEAEQALTEAVEALGFSAFAYVNLGRRRPEAVTQKQFSNQLVVSTTFSHDWKLRYRERRYYNTDPVLFVCRTRMIPVTWAALEGWNDLPGDPRVFDDARAVGMTSGFTVPIHAPSGDNAMVSLASPQTPAELQRSLRESQHNIHLMAFLYHEAMERLRDARGSGPGPTSQ